MEQEASINLHGEKRGLLSVVVPAFNEAGNLPRLYERLRSVLEKDRCRFELIIVDDGSSDRTLAVIQELRLQDPRVHYISLSRNFDHQAPLLGPCSWAWNIRKATLQSPWMHPLEMIPNMLGL